MNCQLEVVIISVTDVDRSLAFYTDQVGFNLDVDYRPTDDFRVVQLTPPGSSCSVQLEPALGGASGIGGSQYLVVPDIEAVRLELRERGVEVGSIRHKSPVDSWTDGWEAGVDPEHRDYASFADFADPDGNRWVLQERGHSTFS